jgi:EAL domain-containing protein (putative c-di-GMP-specific phosphodiesterase class I)/GGDEF domain-containing protein
METDESGLLKTSISRQFDANADTREQVLAGTDRLLSESRNTGELVAVGMLHLLGIDWVNNHLGNRAGDLIIEHVLFLLRHTLGQEATVGYLGESEFALVLLVKHEIFAISTCNRLLTVSTSALEKTGLPLTAHLGLSIAPTDDTDSASLLRNASTAARLARQKSSQTVERFGRDEGSPQERSNDLSWYLPGSLQRNEMFLVYQPVISLQSGSVVKQEAFIRWKHPTRGLIGAGEFIPVAEQGGFITELDTWVLNQANSEALMRQKSGMTKVPVAVNISMSRFSQPDFVETVSSMLTDSGALPLTIELGPGNASTLSHIYGFRPQIHDIRQLGVQVALDDLTIGYNALDYLRAIPVDAVKFQCRSFAQSAEQSNAILIVKAITELAHELGIRVTAEGVETAEQLEIIRSLGIDEAQGYFFGIPQPASVNILPPA